MLYPRPHLIPAPAVLPPVKSIAVSTHDRKRFEFWVLPVPAPRGLIVLWHGYHANRFQVLQVAKGLADRGYTAVLFDGRGHGTRQREACTFGRDELTDLDAILAWRRGDSVLASLPLGMLGFSMGGALACQAAAQNDEIRALVLDSTYARLLPILAHAIRRDYHLPWPWAWLTWISGQLVLRWPLAAKDPVVLARRLRTPCFLLHGEADQSVPVEHLKQLAAAWQGPTAQWVEPGIGHVGLSTALLTRYCDRVAQFFDQWLPPR